MIVRFAFIIGSSLIFFQCPQECVTERLVAKSWYSITEMKRASLFIRNSGKEEIKLPQGLTQGVASDSSTEIYLEILQKMEDGKYVESEKKIVDYSYYLLERNFEIIKPGNEAEFAIQLDFIYKLKTKGTYRVRAFLRLKSFSNCMEKTTSWQEFEVR